MGNKHSGRRDSHDDLPEKGIGWLEEKDETNSYC